MSEPLSAAEPAAVLTRLPRLGEPAPDFEAVTTHGTLRLSDFRDRWLILFSHPADFTPVCTTEFIGFAEIYPELQALGVDLLGLSIDSVYSHIAWVMNIKEKMGVDISFPIIADLDAKVARTYGMIQPGESKTEASRAVFFIDPKGILRAMIYYPLTTGRSMAEMLRVVRALQTNDAHKVATPANWEPGREVILPAPATIEMAQARLAEKQAGTKDWYFTKQPAPVDAPKTPSVKR
jgi:peroxiredoxin (alkyl hydroperoxide reductase subunit C)